MNRGKVWVGYVVLRSHDAGIHFENGEKCDGLASRSHENGTFFAGRFRKR